MEFASEDARPPKRRRAALKGCFEFAKTGQCKRGDECKFKHTTSDQPIPKTHDGVKSNESREPQKRKVPAKSSEAVSNVTASAAKGVGAPRANKVVTPVTPSQQQDSKPSASGTSKHMTSRKFSELPVSAPLIQGIERTMGYTNLTQVQAASLDIILSGRDCLARAKTGTGKTLAFLIPAVEAMLRRGRHQDRDAVCTLVLSPTRELANQIATEATALLSCISNQRVVSITGGTNRKSDVRALTSGAIAVLVATPGRLQDHLQNTPDFGARCARSICTLVFDEADTLLDMGFKAAIDIIMTFMPRREERQTLLFSATVPPAVRQIAKVTLDPNYEFVDTVGDEEEQTHVHVAQAAVVVALEDLWASAFTAILSQMAASGPEHKIIVFCTTARMTGYMADLFRQYLSSGSPRTAGLRTDVLEIHSRKSQSARTKTSDMFRDGQSMILFSSDVSARGMDYPNVTFVLQVGMTDKEQYVHRLGRTARAGKGGGGMILLHDFEERIMLQKHLREMPITTVSGQSLGITAAEFAAVQGVVTASLRNIEMKKSAEQTYQAWLGFYNSHLRDLQWDKPHLVQMANRFAGTMGFPSDSPPALFAKTVGKMGLKGVPGLKIDKNPDTSGNAGNNRGRFGGNK